MNFDTFDTNQLPVLPHMAGRLLELANNEFVDADKLTAVISEEPTVAARILGLAGSALYALREPPRSLHDAIVRVLGVDTTRGITLGLVLNQAFDLNRCEAFDGGKFWRNSLYAAEINHCLAAASSDIAECDKPFAYVSGLVSRIGLLAMASIAPKIISSVLAEQENERLAVRLDRAVGANHKAFATKVAAHWCLPVSIRQAYDYMHSDVALHDDSFSVVTQFAIELSESLIQGSESVPTEIRNRAIDLSLYDVVESLYQQATEINEKVQQLCQVVT